MDKNRPPQGAPVEGPAIKKIYIEFNELTQKLSMNSNTEIPGHTLLGILEYAKASVTRREIMGEIRTVIAGVLTKTAAAPILDAKGQPIAPQPAPEPESATKH